MRKTLFSLTISRRKAFAFAGLILLLAGLVIASLVRMGDGSPPGAFDLTLEATPVPRPLPAQVYRSPSYFTTILRQIFGKRPQFPAPSQIAETGRLQAENEYLDLYSLDNYLPVDISWWQQASTQVYAYVVDRMETATPAKVIVAFVPPRPGRCAPRGTTFHEQRPTILIFAGEDTPRQQLLAVLAHELGHVFIHTKYENLSDLALNEGLATWAAGDYWKEWKGMDFDAGVRSFLNDGTYLPLFQNYYLGRAYDDGSPDCIPDRDILLTEMASFMDYLLARHGAQQLSSLFDVPPPELKDGQRTVHPPAFKDVYGLEFNQLEHEWLRSLLQP